MSHFERSRAEVIEACLTAIRVTKHPYIGFSCEPIAMALDPDDEVEGDYVMTAQVEVRVTDDKLFSSPFRVTFDMGKMRRMPSIHLVRNMAHMASAFDDFAKEINGGTSEATFVTRDGVTDLQSLMIGQEKRKDRLN